MPLYQLQTQQFIAATKQEVWDFISSPQNLTKITPQNMGFLITTPNTPKKIYPGLIISYSVNPFRGYKTTWVTEITHVSEGNYFVDEQRIGPYSMWHHEHHIKEKDGGVLMTDVVSYKPPFGFIGGIANALIIKQKLKKIFAYRERRLNEIFNQDSPE